jgi:hypothetical protein
MKSFLLITSLLSVLQVSAQGAYDPTNDLMTVFGGKCKGYGPLNSTAFNESQSLVSILNDISQDPKCQGLKSALQQVSSLNMNKALSQPDAKLNIEGLVGEAANLQLAITQESNRGPAADADYIAALKRELVDLRIKISTQTENQKLAPRKARLETIQNLDAYSTSLMSGLEQGDACFTNRPNVPAQIGAQMLGIASGLGSGFTGSLLLTAGRAIDHFVRYIRNKSLNSDIQKIVDNRLGQALGCAFEGISQTYCEAADYDVLLKTTQEATTQNTPNPTWKKGLNTSAQGTAAFTEFVNKIDAGSPKTTPGRVADMQSAQNLRAQLELNVTRKDYLVTTGFSNVTELTERTAKDNEFKKLLSDLSDLVTPPCMSNSNGTCLATSGPFKNSFIEDPSCGPQIYIYTKGAERAMKPGTQAGTSCAQYLKNISPQPTIADLPKTKEAMDSIFNEASAFVIKENSKVQQSSNIQVLASARLNIGGRTTLDYFKDADSYLESLLKDPKSIANGDSYSKKQIEETQKRIRGVVGLLEKRAPGTETEAADTVAKIAKELIPKGDKAAIPSALAMIVQLDVEQKIAKGEIDPTLATLMQMPNSGSIGQLLQVYGNLDASGQQTRNARSMSEDSLSGLASAMNQPLKSRFESLKRKADQKDEDAQNSLATLCIQTLAVPEAPLDLNSYCKGTVMKSTYDNSGLILKYDEIARSDKRAKMCSLHDFYRKSSLYGKKKEYLDKNSDQGAR